MKNAFKFAFGFYMGKFVANVTIRLIGKSLDLTARFLEDPDKTIKECKEYFIDKKESQTQEPIKMGFC